MENLEITEDYEKVTHNASIQSPSVYMLPSLTLAFSYA